MAHNLMARRQLAAKALEQTLEKYGDLLDKPLAVIPDDMRDALEYAIKVLEEMEAEERE